MHKAVANLAALATCLNHDIAFHTEAFRKVQSEAQQEEQCRRFVLSSSSSFVVTEVRTAACARFVAAIDSRSVVPRILFCIEMPCAAQTNKSLHASLLAAKSPLSARLPSPIGRSYRGHTCRFSVSAIGAVEKAQAQAKRRPEYVPGRIDDPNYVRIFDTTLRDGEQSPGNQQGVCRTSNMPAKGG